MQERLPLRQHELQDSNQPGDQDPPWVQGPSPAYNNLHQGG